jgi:hypothetical protein
MAYVLRSIFTLRHTSQNIYFPPEKDENEINVEAPRRTDSTRLLKALKVAKLLFLPIDIICGFPVILAGVCCPRRRKKFQRKRGHHGAKSQTKLNVKSEKRPLDRDAAAIVIQTAIRSKLARCYRQRRWKAAVETAEAYQSELARRRAKALAERLARETVLIVTNLATSLCGVNIRLHSPLAVCTTICFRHSWYIGSILYSDGCFLDNSKVVYSTRKRNCRTTLHL